MVSNLLQTRIWTKSQLNSLETPLILLMLASAGQLVFLQNYLMNVLFPESFWMKWKSSLSLSQVQLNNKYTAAAEMNSPVIFTFNSRVSWGGQFYKVSGQIAVLINSRS